MVEAFTHKLEGCDFFSKRTINISSLSDTMLESILPYETEPRTSFLYYVL